MQNLTSLPQSLADICDQIALNGSVCQAFTLNTLSKTAVFYGQAPQQIIDLQTFTLPSQNTSLWVLDAGQPPHGNSGTLDQCIFSG